MLALYLIYFIILLCVQLLQAEEYACEKDLTEFCGVNFPETDHVVFYARQCLYHNSALLTDSCRHYIYVDNPSPVELCMSDMIEYCDSNLSDYKAMYSCLLRYEFLPIITSRCREALEVKKPTTYKLTWHYTEADIWKHAHLVSKEAHDSKMMKESRELQEKMMAAAEDATMIATAVPEKNTNFLRGGFSGGI